MSGSEDGLASSLLRIGIALGAVGTLAGFFGEIWWMLDLAAHLRPHLFVGGAVVTLAAAAMRRWASAGVAGMLSSINGIVIVAAMGGPPPAQAVGPERTVVVANVLTSNRDPAALLTFLEDTDADVVALLEVDPQWAEALTPLSSRYPHQLEQLRSDNFGVALYSRWPLTEEEVLRVGGTGLPSVKARVQADGGSFVVVATHPPPPASSLGSGWRDAQLSRLTEKALALGEPATLLVGDLNATPWSAPFRRLRAAGWRDASAVPRPTWPSGLGWLGIPIDHVLHLGGIVVVDERVGPAIGSDHRPLVVRFRLAQGSGVQP